MMGSLKDLAKEIIEEIRRIQNLSTEEISEEWKKERNFPLPGMISRGDGHGIIISPRIDKIISEIVKIKTDGVPSLANSYRDAELHKILQEALGLSLAEMNIHDDIDNNSQKILQDIEASLNKRTRSYGDREYAFGCTLFSNKDVPAFSIGAVRFEPKMEWLNRKRTEKYISSICFRRINSIWIQKKVGKRKSSKDEMKERAILEAIDSYQYVCSVSTQGLPPATGEEKSLMVARLALTAISLIWEIPSRALDGFRLSHDGKSYLKKSLSFSEGTVWGLGSAVSHNPFGQHVTVEQWQHELTRHKTTFSICEEIFAYILSPSGHVPRQKMMETLAQALIWFHAASRERDNLVAIVKYAACLDALSCGGKSGGICRLITKQLGIPKGGSVFKGVIPMEKTVEEIYSSGRSRTIHGTNDKVGHDWSTTRTQAEILARICFLCCADWAEKNPSIGDPLQLSR